ncbi:tRNA (N6-isopentenyl adenosine(37)-C2)-methylthiotransferase MiaB [Cryobacterium sp. 10I1]|uniref:tRNA (N6-isopentenyl adenosine(37)-C2)-methylthiotransferase MiaB n=1 Tax=unclassified Cryobacterium TaxID=2649013 RepID=UPI003A598C7C
MTLSMKTLIAPSPAARDDDGRARTYEVRTFGCQMNVHDSERLSGSLEAAGYVPADGAEADIVVLNTCAVRENADNKLYGNLGQLASIKRRHAGMQIAVGGCLAQKDKDVILGKAPWVDVVFGTHNMGALPSLLERARHNGEAQLEILDALETFPSTLPTKRDSSYSGWVSISVGCNNTCTFCIVPALRGKEKDRRPGEILAEIQALVDDGAIEVTLLGQNVNSYGVEFGDRLAFGKLLRAAGKIEGLERIRFTSPHPAAFTDDVIEAMADTPAVMPQLHMPLQSGSDRVLKAMRRSYRSERFLGILDRVRARMPDAAISTDIIVGFPGETEEDFQETLRVVERARFATAFTFQYSIRPGTPAAEMADQVPKEIVQDRYERLAVLQERISWEENQAVIGRELELLVANGEGRKDSDTHRMSGRAPDSRLVHFDVPDGSERPRPGDLVTVTVTQAAPFHLIADSPDGAPLRIRRTTAGDAWDRAEADACGVPSHAGTSAAGSVSLGMPTLGLRPAAPHATPHSATPHSATPHSATPHSATPHPVAASAAAQGPAPVPAVPTASGRIPAVNASSTVPIYAVDDGER